MKARPGARPKGSRLRGNGDRPRVGEGRGADEDPKAVGGAGVLAIGPQQNDPARPGAAAVARPGDDEDPKARCVPTGR